MFDLFPDGPVYEYPQLINITYSFTWAFLLASIIAITHRLTFTNTYYPKNFFQSLILGAVVTTMVMMAIGDSLARGLGVFGAMAIIRFRTRIDDPRDVLFLFAALSTGLAIGVYGFTISFIGTLMFCFTAFILHASPFRSYLQPYTISFTLTDNKELGLALTVLDIYCTESRHISTFRTKDNETRYEYSIALKKGVDNTLLINELTAIQGLKRPRFVLKELTNL